jgi:hypothetical protein
MDQGNIEDLYAGIPHDDQTLVPLDMAQYREPFHVIGYSWNKEGPVWTLLKMRREGGVLKSEGMPFEIELVSMDEIDLRTSPGQFCVGRFNGDEYIPCPCQARVEQFAQCPSCMMFDIPDPACVFEPHCNRGPCGADLRCGFLPDRTCCLYHGFQEPLQGRDDAVKEG